MSTVVSTSMMANAIRALAMDAIQKAKSGHPGMPMGMAEIGVALWTRHLRHNPTNPQWMGRDRFILSNGHGSMLQYALLHLTGYDLTIEDIKNFRQFGSKTPGHPEWGVTAGVETSTGPLGQGIANGVGMALAEKMLAAEFNREGFPVVDNHTYVFLGDGCMMEGLSHEACSLAGTWKLNKLIAIYDDNGISIDGDVKGWLTDDPRKRFESYGWNVIGPVDGHDVEALDAAITEAKTFKEKPTLIIAKTVIGKGSPNRAGKSKSHGEALGEEEIALTREAIGWPYPAFEIPAEVYAAMDARPNGQEMQAAYDAMYEKYKAAYPELAAELERRLVGDLPAAFEEKVMEALCKAAEAAETVATRKASLKALNALAPSLPEMLGGSADLTGSNLTAWDGVVRFSTENVLGRHISYGVREFAMTAIGNGIALYGGFIPFSATFLTFSDYERNAIRMAALMGIRNIAVLTHDSLGVGEDGPTHQPIEHTASLRLIPNLNVWRPADTIESVVAWASAIESKRTPSALIFSRQNVEFTERDEVDADAIAKGGYVVAEAPAGEGKAAVIIAASGSELPIAMKARALLTAQNVQVRVVSMPCMNIFDRQEKEYRQAVFTPGVPVLGIEAGVTAPWYKYMSGKGDVIGIDCFGMSAPAGKLWPHFGFTVENAVAKALELIK